jgi:hypothetical protein
VFIASVVALIVSPCTLFLYASFNDHSDMHTKPLTHLIMHQPLCLTSWLHHYYHCLFAYVDFCSAERWNCASVLISTVWPANFILVSKKFKPIFIPYVTQCYLCLWPLHCLRWDDHYVMHCVRYFYSSNCTAVLYCSVLLYFIVLRCIGRRFCRAKVLSGEGFVGRRFCRT